MPAGVPQQLPADIPTFTGRAVELERLLGLLNAAPDPRAGADGGPTPVVICAIDGAGGVGKSVLALHAAHQVAEWYPDGQLYVNLHGATPGVPALDPAEALGRFLRALGVADHEVPAETEEAAAMFRSLVAARRMLVVLDNAESVAQVRPLLPASGTCAVLVTSRQVMATLDGAAHLHLNVLSLDEAVVLLAWLVGERRAAAEPEAVAALAQQCGYLPLALRIAGARLAARPAWPVRALGARLADTQRRLDELAFGEVALRAALQVSDQALLASTDPVGQEAARAFRLLGLPDGPDMTTDVAAHLLDRPYHAAERALERLVDAQLLETPSPGRYRLHDLLRLFAREQATQDMPEEERRAALGRLWLLAGCRP
jgi:hypothetical protein